MTDAEDDDDGPETFRFGLASDDEAATPAPPAGAEPEAFSFSASRSTPAPDLRTPEPDTEDDEPTAFRFDVSTPAPPTTGEDGTASGTREPSLAESATPRVDAGWVDLDAEAEKGTTWGGPPPLPVRNPGATGRGGEAQHEDVFGTASPSPDADGPDLDLFATGTSSRGPLPARRPAAWDGDGRGAAADAPADVPIEASESDAPSQPDEPDTGTAGGTERAARPDADRAVAEALGELVAARPTDTDAVSESPWTDDENDSRWFASDDDPDDDLDEVWSGSSVPLEASSVATDEPAAWGGRGAAADDDDTTAVWPQLDGADDMDDEVWSAGGEADVSAWALDADTADAAGDEDVGPGDTGGELAAALADVVDEAAAPAPDDPPAPPAGDPDDPAQDWLEDLPTAAAVAATAPEDDFDGLDDLDDLDDMLSSAQQAADEAEAGPAGGTAAPDPEQAADTDPDPALDPAPTAPAGVSFSSAGSKGGKRRWTSFWRR